MKLKFLIWIIGLIVLSISVLALTYTAEYPPAHTDVYVKATTTGGGFQTYWATDLALSLTGVASPTTSWGASTSTNANQRFHIDLGSAKIIRRVYSENYHHIGTDVNAGVKNYILQGSNSNSSFLELTYATDTGWTTILSGLQFPEHTASDVADPEFSLINNTVAYRYYAFKIADNWGRSFMGVRHLNLQTEDGFGVDTTPPTADDWNVTSGNVVAGESTIAWRDDIQNYINITNGTLSYTFTSNESSNHSAYVDSKTDYLNADANHKAATTETTLHANTVYDNFSSGDHFLFISLIDLAGNVRNYSLNFTAVDNITITINFVTPLNSSGSSVGDFNTSNLEEIETMELNFTIRSTFENISDWYLNFTSNGTSSCSLGNLQNSVCYNFTNSNTSRKWIEFINGSETTTFDGTAFGIAIGDGITPTISKSADGKEWNVSIIIDEHYNPNVLKHYDALYNFSDIKFQNGTNQRITGNTIIEIHLGHLLVPLNADQYKLDIRVNTSSILPNQPIESHLCNSTYKLISGNPVGNPACALVVTKLQSEFQDDGTKHRGIFTKQLVDELGNILFLLLRTDENNPNRYYFIKTYKATSVGYNTHWNFSNDNGETYSNLADGYETEANINWFIDGADPTAFMGNIYANNTGTVKYTNLFNQTWDIDPSQKYNPVINLILPEVDQTVECPFNITWSVDDPNDDNLNVSLFLFDGSILNQTIQTNMNQSNTSYYWNCSDVYGYWFNLTIEAKKIVDEGFNSSDTHQIIVYECTYECTLFDSCQPNSTGGYKDCLTVNETEICVYTGNYSEFRESCNYCDEDINLYNTPTENEFCNDYTLLQNMTYYYVDDNYYDCCNVTNASSDCNILNETLYFNYTQIDDCSSIDCLYDESPYLKFFDKKIPLICVVNKNTTYDFLVYVKADNQTIQTNPKRQLIEDYGEYNSFKSENGLVNLYYTSTTLRPDRNVTVIVEGQNGLFYNEFVAAPTYKDPFQLQDRLFWTWDNAGLLIGGVFIFLILAVFVVFLIRFGVFNWKN